MKHSMHRRLMRFPFAVVASLLMLVGNSIAQEWLFPKMSWKEPDFQDRFLGRFGVNGYTEPLMDVENFNLYEGVMAQIEDKEAAVAYLMNGMTILQDGGVETSAALHFVLGSIVYELGRKEEAVEQYITAIRKHPSFLRAYANLGFVFMELDQPDKALPVLLKAVELGANEAQIHGLIGYIYQQKQLFASGLTSYQWATVFNPENNAWRLGLLQCYIGLDRYAEAVGVAEEVLAFDRSNPANWSNLANLLVQLDRHDDAIVHLQTAIALGANGFSTWQTLAALLLKKGITILGADALTHATGAAGTREELNQVLAQCFALSANQQQEAAIHLLDTLRPRAQTLDTTLDPTLTGLVEVADMMRRGALDEAESLLQRLADEAPGNGEVQIQLARVLIALNRLAEAEAALDVAATLPETRYIALYEHARLKLRNNDIETALRFLREANGIQPTAELAAYISNLEQYRR